jgi:hypothetical protein
MACHQSGANVKEYAKRWWRLVEQKALNVEWPLEEIRRATKDGMDQKSLKTNGPTRSPGYPRDPFGNLPPVSFLRTDVGPCVPSGA